MFNNFVKIDKQQVNSDKSNISLTLKNGEIIEFDDNNGSIGLKKDSILESEYEFMGNTNTLTKMIADMSLSLQAANANTDSDKTLQSRYSTTTTVAMLQPSWVRLDISVYCKICVIIQSNEEIDPNNLPEYGGDKNNNVSNNSYVLCENQRILVSNIPLKIKFFNKDYKMKGKYLFKLILSFILLISCIYTCYNDLNKLSNRINSGKYKSGWNNYQCYIYTLVNSSNFKRAWLYLNVGGGWSSFTIATLVKSKSKANFELIKIASYIMIATYLCGITCIFTHMIPGMIMAGPFMLGLLCICLPCYVCRDMKKSNDETRMQLSIASDLESQNNDDINSNDNNNDKIKCIAFEELESYRRVNNVSFSAFYDESGNYMSIVMSMGYIIVPFTIAAIIRFYAGVDWWESIEITLTERNTQVYLQELHDQTNNVFQLIAWFF